MKALESIGAFFPLCLVVRQMSKPNQNFITCGKCKCKCIRMKMIYTRWTFDWLWVDGEEATVNFDKSGEFSFDSYTTYS